MLLLHEHAIVDRVMTGSYFETDFASFLAWRDWGFTDQSVRNAFPQAALKAADGAFLLGVMGAHTANAGHIYFPSGTPDPADVDGDRVDIGASLTRELREETGLDAGDFTVDPGWTAVFDGPRIALFRIVRSAEPAAVFRERILPISAASPSRNSPTSASCARRRTTIPHMTGYVTAYLDDVFARQPADTGLSGGS